jgi:hypothetical protein
VSAGVPFDEYFSTAHPPGPYRAPPGTLFDRVRADGGRARIRVASGFLIVERLGPDEKIIAAQRFEGTELELGSVVMAVRQARALLCGIPAEDKAPIEVKSKKRKAKP